MGGWLLPLARLGITADLLTTLHGIRLPTMIMWGSATTVACDLYVLLRPLPRPLAALGITRVAKILLVASSRGLSSVTQIQTNFKHTSAQGMANGFLIYARKVGPVGIEPTTKGLWVPCSDHWATGPNWSDTSWISPRCLNPNASTARVWSIALDNCCCHTIARRANNIQPSVVFGSLVCAINYCVKALANFLLMYMNNMLHSTPDGTWTHVSPTTLSTLYKSEGIQG